MELNDIKNAILSLKTSDSNEVYVDDVENYCNIDRTHVVCAMKIMKDEHLGEFVIGRKGGRSRFVFGMQAKPPDKSVLLLVTAFKRLIIKKQEQFPETSIIINVDDFAGKFPAKSIIEAFAILTKENVGEFIVGRKGGKSRFEVGRKKKNIDEILRRSNGSEYDLPQPEDGPFAVNSLSAPIVADINYSTGYNLIRCDNVLYLRFNVSNGFSSVKEVVKHYCADMNEIIQNRIETALIRFGFVVCN